MNSRSEPTGPTPWLTLEEIAERLQVSRGQVRTMLSEDRLLAVRRGPGRALMVPAGFLGPGTDAGPDQVPAALRGTLIQLSDAGLDAEQTVDWLFTPNAELGAAPMTLLHAGHIHAVRRASQSLAF